VTLAAILLAAVLSAASGLACLLIPGGGRWGDRAFAGIMTGAGLLGASAAMVALVRGVEADFAAPWPLPWGRLGLRLDALSAAFLLPVFVVPALGAVYSAAYWREGHAPAARSLRVFYGLLAGSMVLVVLAHDGVFFLVAWELMAISAFFAIATEDRKPDVRRAAWVYFVATHLGTLALIALFALLNSGSGRFDLSPIPAGALQPALATGVFLLAVFGFGLKAGIMPLHVWLPGAHANAPSHVSAVLSGVMLKMGLYGLFRVTSLLPEIPPWWGWLLVSLGAGSAFLGITFAVAQHDYKRLLAYSSIENIGVVVLGLGAALVGRATGDPTLTALALTGALLHVWNHALFKSLLFFVAGSVLHATGTRRMNLLGGLARAMPWTAAGACLGCIAIGAMPPLNGFVSEWLIYRGFLQGVAPAPGGMNAWFAGAAAALALTGGLAAVTFTRLYAVIFLGTPRSEATKAAHEAPAAMLGPMAVLGAVCVGIGLIPWIVAPLLAPAVRLVGGPTAGDALGSGLLSPLRTVGAVSACILLAGAAGLFALRWYSHAAHSPRSGTWDCGYARPSSSMQYGESSLGQMVVSLFAWALITRRRDPAFDGPFPGAASYRTETPDVALDRAIRPGLRGLTRLVMRLRLLQQAKIQIYMVYILLIVVILLALEGP
jgi:formate hydrogenlyase subunit 3/multisubunit Na+/H+ antiporter MnhD subunit